MALLIDRKAYTRKGHKRKGYRRKGGVYVDPSYVDKTRVPKSRFRIRDRGKRGRGPKVVPKLKKGTLGVSFNQPASTRHRIELSKARRVGEKSVGGKLQAIAVLNKRTNPTVARKAAADRRFVYGSMKGRKVVGYGKGFT